MQWMHLGSYVQPILLGLVRSAGGRNNNRELLNDSVGALASFLGSLRTKPESLLEFSVSLLAFWDFFCTANKSEFQAAAFYRILEIIISSDLFSRLKASSFATEFAGRLSVEFSRISTRSKLPERLASFSTLLAAFVPVGDPSSRSSTLGLLVSMLANPFPVVRKAAAEALLSLMSIFAELWDYSSSIVHALGSISWDTVSTEAAVSESLLLYRRMSLEPPAAVLNAKERASVVSGSAEPISSAAAPVQEINSVPSSPKSSENGSVEF